MALKNKTALLTGVAQEARRHGLLAGDHEVREMLRLATMWWEEGAAPAHTAARWAGTMVMRGRRRRAG